MELLKLTEEALKQLENMSRDVIPNYTDEKLEDMVDQWINFEFIDNDWETKEQYESRKEIMLKVLIDEKLKRMEATYVE